MNQAYELIVSRGEDIRKKIEAFVLNKGWESAYISGAVGSAYDVSFTVPVGQQFPLRVESVLCPYAGEILSFTGEIMQKQLMDPELREIYKEDGPLFIHIHASMGTAGAHVHGGGFQSGRAFRALKVYISETKGGEETDGGEQGVRLNP